VRHLLLDEVLFVLLGRDAEPQGRRRTAPHHPVPRWLHERDALATEPPFGEVERGREADNLGRELPRSLEALGERRELLPARRSVEATQARTLNGWISRPPSSRTSSLPVFFSSVRRRGRPDARGGRPPGSIRSLHSGGELADSGSEPEPRDQSTAELFKRSSHETTTLVRQEIGAGES
jgi:hypothetical protein